MCSVFFLVAIVGFTVTTGFYTAGAAMELTPHRAIYSMTLGTSSGTGGPASVRGVMSYDFQSRCDAWTVESKVFLKMDTGGNEVESVRKIVTWEGKDGLGFRFRMRETHGGKTVQEIKGVALLADKDEAGIVEYVKPKRFRVDLPKGTLFPTTHIERIISESVSGGNYVGRHLFDGASLDEPYMVSAFIEKKREQQDAVKNAREIQKLETWNARLAYFPVKSSSQIPEFEMGVRYRKNGVVEKLIQDYGSYTIVSRLNQLELLPAERC